MLRETSRETGKYLAKPSLNRGLPFRSAVVAALCVAVSACSDGNGHYDPSLFRAAVRVDFYNGQAASVVIGQPNFTSNTAATTADGLSGPYGNPDVVNGVLYLSDYYNNRVLGFNAVPVSNGASANFVLGQPDFITARSGTNLKSMSGPQTVADDGGKLFVLEYNNSRVDVYDPVPTAGTSAPKATVPQAISFTITGVGANGFSHPETLAVGGGKLVVTDTSKNRVLIWNTIPSSDASPDLVLGQQDFSGTSPNGGLSAPTASTLNEPAGAWTDGQRLVVLDSNNNRVLIWNTFPTVNDAPADRVLGQADFGSNLLNAGNSLPRADTLSYPYDGVYVNGDQLFVADNNNGRVLIWNTWPAQDGQPADVVLGQADFTSIRKGPTASIMSCPAGLMVAGSQLIVGDSCDNRYLVFNSN